MTEAKKMRIQYEEWRDNQVRDGIFYGGYTESEDDIAWAAFQASREAVVVELPSAFAYEGLTEHLGSLIELSYEAPEHDPVGLARLPDVRSAIESQGLRVSP